jgi:hypothetical protein
LIEIPVATFRMPRQLTNNSSRLISSRIAAAGSTQDDINCLVAAIRSLPRDDFSKVRIVVGHLATRWS